MKSLELNWIRKKVDKTIPIPEMMFFPFSDGRAGSYYTPSPKNEIYDVDGKPYSLIHGAIVVSSKYDSGAQKNIIAHEWRHHWQLHQFGPKFVHDNLKRFEKDASRFEHKHSPNLWSEENFLKV